MLFSRADSAGYTCGDSRGVQREVTIADVTSSDVVSSDLPAAGH
jgi:hypothetical protein